LINAKTILLWHAPPIPFAPPILADDQLTGVIADFSHQVIGNEVMNKTFFIPRGEFDLHDELKKNNIAKCENLFICIDATLPFLIRNLKKAASNVYLILGDTHHLDQPISKVRSYLSSEIFDGIIFTNNVRHSHWFRDVTNAQFYFEPGIFALNLKSHRFLTERKSQVVFYGQIGQYHPRRSRLLPGLIENNKIRHIKGSSSEISMQLSSSIASVNPTLNSDLNSRVFEIAQTGALLIIDRLSVFNGHGSILIPGHNCLTFNSQLELTELLDDLDYLKEMQSICGVNFQNEFDNYLGIDSIKSRIKHSNKNELLNFNACDSNLNRFELESDSVEFNVRLNCYESFLELHRQHESLNVFIDSPFRDIFVQDLIDMPRVKFVDTIDEFDFNHDFCFYVRYQAGDELQIFQIKN